MKPSSHFIIFSVIIVCGSSQRSPYAGRRPIGYPVIETTTSADLLGNKFGENVNATTQRLPVDALGDRDLVNRVSQYPPDQQPFWLLNSQALDEHRKRQQTFSIRPSVFANPTIPQNMGNQNDIDFMLGNRNGGSVMPQNIKPNDQVGSSLQQKPNNEVSQSSQQKPNDQIAQSIPKKDQSLVQFLMLSSQNAQDMQSNLRPTEQNKPKPGQNLKQPQPIPQDSEQNLKTNLPNNRIVLQSFFPITNQGIQVNPTPPQASQASWTMANI